MLLGYSYGKAFERLQVIVQEIVLCTTRSDTLPCLSLPTAAGQASPAFITPKMGAGLTCFWPGVPVVAMAQKTGIEPKPVLPALNYLRLAFQTDYPIFFSATVEIDKTYILDGQ